MLTLHTPATPVLRARVVVMGARGFVGSAIADRLERDATVVRLSRAEANLLGQDGAANLRVHLTPDTTLVVTSAIAPVKTSAMLLDNLRMMQAVIEAVKAAPVAHVVYVSSDAVYADSPSALTEASPAEPGSLHGVMHLAREVMLKNELAGIPLVCIRPTLIFGPGDPHNGYGPNRFMRCVRAGQDIMLFGQGEERRDHVFIDDVAEIVARCALRRATGTINAVSGTVTSFRTIADMARTVGATLPAKIVDTPRVGAMPHNGYRAFDASLPARLFPDLRITTLAEGLERIAASVLP
jgi:nucleoside-diphosphate-sugar epimerase